MMPRFWPRKSHVMFFCQTEPDRVQQFTSAHWVTRSNHSVRSVPKEASWDRGCFYIKVRKPPRAGLFATCLKHQGPVHCTNPWICPCKASLRAPTTSACGSPYRSNSRPPKSRPRIVSFAGGRVSEETPAVVTTYDIDGDILRTFM